MKKALITLSAVFTIFTILAQSPQFLKDIDGNVYPTVIIGKQEWMAENLKTTRFNDGTKIPLITNDAEWGYIVTSAYSWYNNDEKTYRNNYGALYNWYTVSTGKLCPKGWHVPSDGDWDVLTDFLGGEITPGGQILLWGELKSTSKTPDEHPRWDFPNTGATNKTGFTSLPGGFRSYLGSYDYIGKFGFWWSSVSSGIFALHRGMRYDNGHVFRATGTKNNGFSVRCIKE